MVEAHVADYKKKIVADFVNLMSEYPIVGVVNMENLPAQQLQNMREQLRDMVVLRMTKKRFLKIAFDAAKSKVKGIEGLTEHLRGMPALIFTKENPFKVYKNLQKNKSKAPAKAGQTAPNDIVINAGATPFAPGPIIGELGSLGLKTGVEGGKVAIKEDKVVVKEGEVIPAKTAELLTRLGIQPMEVGLDLIAVYEKGTIYKKDILAIDEVQFSADLNNAARWAFNLSVEACYPTKDNIELLVIKSFRDAKGLALEQNILADAVMGEVLAKAERQMLALKTTANIEVTAKPAPAAEEKPAEEAKEEVKEEKPKVEEKKEEAVAEKPTAEEPKEEPQPEEKPVETKPKEEQPEAPIEPEKTEETPKEEPEEKKETPEPQEEEPKPEPQEEKAPAKQEIPKEDLLKLDKPQHGKVEDILPQETEEDIEQNIKEEMKVVKQEVEQDLKQAEKEIEQLPPEKQEEAKEQLAEIKELEEDALKVEKERKKPDVETAEKLYEQLKKKGTLRNVPVEPTKKKVIKKESDVPSAHELAARKKKKTQS